MKNVMVNPDRCVGCRHCEVACALEHSLSGSLPSALNETPLSAPRIFVETGIDYLTLPHRCRHCEPAPCAQVCPTGTLYRDRDTETVAIDYRRCISCSACAIVCPFGVIRFGPVAGLDPIREVNTKCDGCPERVSRGEIPACVEACKTGALTYGDVDELARAGRRDLTIRMFRTREAEVEAPAVPPAISLQRKIMSRLYSLGPFSP